MSDKFLRLVEILAVQNTIFAAKASVYLMAVVAVFGNKTLLRFKEISDGSWLLLATRTWS